MHLFFLSHDKALIVLLPAFLLALALALRARRKRVPGWLWLLCDSLLVPLAFGCATALTYAFMDLGELKTWKEFPKIAFYSGAPIAFLVSLVPDRWRAVGAGLVLSLVSLVILGDLVYLRFFGNILPLLAASSGGQIWDVRDTILANIYREDTWLAPMAIASLSMPFLWPRDQRRFALAARIPAQIALVAGSAWLSLPIQRDVDAWMKSTRSWRVLNGADSVQSAGVVVAHIREVRRVIREAGIDHTPTPQDLKNLKRFFSKRASDAKVEDDFGLFRKKSFLVVQCEAMQAWVIGTKANGREITPFLNRLRNRALYFPNIFNQTGESPTSDCEYLVTNSLHPLRQGSVAFRCQKNDFVAFPAELGRAGYSTFSAHAYMRGMWNRAVLHPKWGFSDSFFQDEIGDGEKLGWGIGDKEFFDRMAPRIEKAKKPFLGFLITLTSHAPYSYVPQKYRELSIGTLERTQLGNYIHSIHYLDQALEQFFGRLERDGVLENTVVVVYGDHDSKMMFRGGEESGALRVLDLPPAVIRHLARREFETNRIPLFVVPPKSVPVAPASIGTVGGQMDIGPTVLHLAGVKRPTSFLGRSLYPEHPGWAAKLDGSIASQDKLWVRGGRGRCETFPEEAPLPANDCKDMKKQADKELEISSQVTLGNAARALSTP